MGHERVGYLPKSKSWTKIVESIHGFSSSHSDVSTIARQTLKNVKGRFLALGNDDAFHASFKCIVILSYANRTADPLAFLSKHGLNLSSEAGLFQLTCATQKLMEIQKGSKEYSTLATKALIDTINNWVRTNKPSTNLFQYDEGVLGSWKKASEGKGFCEVSREYFCQFTTQYLKYFLDRTASAQIDSISDRHVFSEAIKDHIADISVHAFETSKIAQSFSAGWFNANAKDSFPSDKKIKGFLGVVTKKIYDELSREERATKY